ncbi:hypothetical protein HY384_03960 [Candidatus Daviesbacteria bacterium]|nr:hypothetical protein [Candidatus Daviesbacteria bacterium]
MEREPIPQAVTPVVTKPESVEGIKNSRFPERVGRTRHLKVAADSLTDALQVATVGTVSRHGEITSYLVDRVTFTSVSSMDGRE